jgi:hypothetical protein
MYKHGAVVSHELKYMGQSVFGIRCVLQDAVAKNDIERFLLKRQIDNAGLYELNIGILADISLSNINTGDINSHNSRSKRQQNFCVRARSTTAFQYDFVPKILATPVGPLQECIHAIGCAIVGIELESRVTLT